MKREEDELEIIEDNSPSMNHVATYASDDTAGMSGGDPLFNDEIGLAMEPLKGDGHVSELWQLYA